MQPRLELRLEMNAPATSARWPARWRGEAPRAGIGASRSLQAAQASFARPITTTLAAPYVPCRLADHCVRGSRRFHPAGSYLADFSASSAGVGLLMLHICNWRRGWDSVPAANHKPRKCWNDSAFWDVVVPNCGAKSLGIRCYEALTLAITFSR